MSHDDLPHTWYTTNLVGVGAPVLASTEFNAHPVALRIVAEIERTRPALTGEAAARGA